MTVFLLLALFGSPVGRVWAAAPGSPTAASTTQCFQIDADSYISNLSPNTNRGGSTTLALSSVGDIIVNQNWILLRFDLDAIPDGATVLSADLDLYSLGGAGGTSTTVRAVESNWTEYGITWNNAPSTGTFSYDTLIVNSTTGIRTWHVDQLVNEWITGARTNYGLAIRSYGVGSPWATFHSSEGSLTRPPRLCVEWTENSVSTDIVIDAIEITQAVQNLQNDVDLVEGKRTFVRVHAHTTNGSYRTFASLAVSRGGSSATLYPLNPGAHIVVQPNPDREALHESFLFELPSFYTKGVVSMQATVNSLQGWRPSRYPPETNYTNNSMGASATFQSVPRIGLIVFRGTYTLEDGGTVTAYTTPITDVFQARSWLRRAYPISDIWMTIRPFDLGEGSLNPDKPSRLSYPNSGAVNALLKGIRTTDLDNDSWYESFVGDESDIRYYAMIDDDGGFMRGSMGSRAGSGPTGAIGGWDTDGIYGDWYAGHEVGHSFGRSHVKGDPGGKPGDCGGEAGVDSNYPHTDGFISTDTTGPQAYFGFDVGSRYQGYGLIPADAAVFGPDWREMMTYCAPNWISDYTYEGIMSKIQDSVTPLAATTVRTGVLSVAGTDAPIDRLQVLGTIDPGTGEAHLFPLFVIPDAADVVARVPGSYAIVLRNNSGELVRYAFTPEETHSGPDDPNGASAPQVQTLVISEFVPYVVGTTRVDIEGPSGLLATLSAGANAPQVTVVSPNGGETVSGDTLPISWTASDQDGDDLVFNVEFSRDNGLTWETFAQHVTGTSVEIPREYIASTSQGLIRVWASDGIHTTSDTSDATFTTATRDPEIQILSPAPETYVAANQTLSLVALAYSINVGTPQSEQVTWTSSVDGALGNGEELSVTGLTPGVHHITVTFDDGVASSSVTVYDIVVVADPRTLPVPPDELVVGPKTLVFWPEEGISAQTVSVGNLAGSDSLSFGSLEFTSWLSVSPATGNTPGEVTVSINATNLAPGIHDARIAFASVETTGSTFVDVVVTIPERAFRVMLPLVLR